MADMAKLLKRAQDEAEDDAKVTKMRSGGGPLDEREAHLAWIDSRINQVSNITYAESQEIKNAYQQAFLKAGK